MKGKIDDLLEFRNEQTNTRVEYIEDSHIHLIKQH